MSDRIERRGYPRAKAELALKIDDAGAIIESKVQNISCSGVHCQIKKEFPLMTKVVIILLVPSFINNKIDDFNKIKCEGVIVRTQPVAERDEILYNTAIFFTDLSGKDREKIAHFVKYKLLKKEQVRDGS
jgi:hypothetical protein